MEDLFLVPPSLTWFDLGSGGFWTKDENKMFESALALFDEDTPDRWINVAALIPGKSARDVESKYRELLEDVTEIEEGRVPIPGYERDFYGSRKRPYGGRDAGDHERKKGVPWTEEEHRRFLMGLVKYGKGDWRNISRNFVISKTPTQVASHAQKYFIRQLPGGKDKRRPSIHDITTMSITDSDSAGSLASTQQKLMPGQGLGIGGNDGEFIIFESNRRKPLTTNAFGSSMMGVRPRSHHQQLN